MAKEEKQEQETAQSQQAQDGDTAKESTTATITEEQYKELQAKLDAEQKAREEAESTLELVQPYVNFDAMNNTNTDDRDTSDMETEFISKKELQKQLAEIDKRYNTALLALRFRTDHPDLKPYEKTLVVPAVASLRQKHPSWTADKIISEAAKVAREFLKNEREKAVAETKAKDDEAKKKAAAAGGFSSTQSTSPKTEDTGKSPQELLDTEQKRRLRLQGENV